jgi:glycosidase
MDSISFFYKNPIKFGKYKRAAFYKTLLTLRASTPALATDASFKKVHVGDDKTLYAYVREKDRHKILVILNLSAKEQTIKADDPSLTGEPVNVFMGTKEAIKAGHSFNIEPWGYVVYDYDVRP